MSRAPNKSEKLAIQVTKGYVSNFALQEDEMYSCACGRFQIVPQQEFTSCSICLLSLHTQNLTLVVTHTHCCGSMPQCGSHPLYNDVVLLLQRKSGMVVVFIMKQAAVQKSKTSFMTRFQSYSYVLLLLWSNLITGCLHWLNTTIVVV